ncbi:MAG: hypothetical protein ACI8Z9_000440, partial [Paraglaciecola sp.]
MDVAFCPLSSVYFDCLKAMVCYCHGLGIDWVNQKKFATEFTGKEKHSILNLIPSLFCVHAVVYICFPAAWL